MSRILLVDNYDSFTYNLQHYLEQLCDQVDVFKNDQLDLIDIQDYMGVVLSPGPGLPVEAGALMELIAKCDGLIPVFGVCLGMQAIAEYLDGKLYNQETVKHGIQADIRCLKSVLFEEEDMVVGLYHSWAVEEAGNFRVTARSMDNIVMAIENLEHKMIGVQFHPESIMTPKGFQIIRKFINFSTQTNLKTN